MAFHLLTPSYIINYYMKTVTILEIIIILSIIGMIDSAYLTYEHYQLLSNIGEGSFCDISEELSCSTVNSSPYAEVMGIPMAFLGLVWFIVVIILAYALESKHKFWKAAPLYLFLWSILGLLSVFWLVYAELFLIGSICILCTLAHVLIIIILFLSYKILKRSNRSIGKYLEEIFYK